MSRGINQLTVLGWVGQDAVSQNVGHTTITKFSLATSEEWKDKEGEQQTRVEWHTVVTFGKHADFLADKVKKGMQVYAQGKKVTSKWKTKEGEDRTSVELHAYTVHLMFDDKKKTEEKESTAEDIKSLF